MHIGNGNGRHRSQTSRSTDWKYIADDAHDAHDDDDDADDEGGIMEGKGDVVDANLPRFHLEPHSEPDWYSGQGLIDCQCIRDILIDC